MKSLLPTKSTLANSLHKFAGKLAVNYILILVLTITLVFAAVPGYLRGGNWSWSDLPALENVTQMRALVNEGIKLNEWQTVRQKRVRLGGKKWSFQLINNPLLSDPVMVLIAPQTYYTDKPYVEWTDIQGIEDWKIDSMRSLEFSGSEDSDVSPVKARFFRAWNKQTFAVVQWYAFPDGGSPSSADWFWRDTKAQLEGKRVPWIAVCLKIPLNPLDELESVADLAKDLGKQVQGSLQVNVFSISDEQNDK